MGALSISDLARWGFTDTSKDGKVSLDELPAYKDVKFQADQLKAFQNLAKLSGDPNAIEASDLEMLQSNPSALAGVMRNDPEYQGDLIARAVLKQGEKEVKSTGSDARDGIRPVAYQRLVTFAQLALQHQGARLSASGVYDAKTATAVRDFQQKVGLDAERDGTFIDRSTFAALEMSQRISPAELKVSLQAVKTWLEKQRPTAFMMDAYERSHPKQVDNIRQYVDLIITTLQYLYPQDVPAWKSENRLAEANACLQKHFGTAWVGPKTFQRLLDAVDARMKAK